MPVSIPSRSIASSVKLKALTPFPVVPLTVTDSSASSSSALQLEPLAIISASAAKNAISMRLVLRLNMVLLDERIRFCSEFDIGAHQWDDQQTEQGGADHPSENDARHRLHELEPRDVIGQSEGQKHTG